VRPLPEGIGGLLLYPSGPAMKARIEGGILGEREQFTGT